MTLNDTDTDASKPIARTQPSHRVTLNGSRLLFQNPWDVRSSEFNATSSQWTTFDFTRLPTIPTSFNIPLQWASSHTSRPHAPVKVVKPNFERVLDGRQAEVLRATWLGHAAFLLETPRSRDKQSIRILFDPIFSEKVGPSPWVGIQRSIPSPCTFEELPDIHVVAISHNHYDHLDYPTICKILERFGDGVQFVVPLGLKAWFVSSGATPERVHEFDWWDGRSFTIIDPTAVGSTADVKVACVPAQHTSGRSGMDNRTTLWCGWIIEQDVSRSSQENYDAEPRKMTVYYAGDTGYQTTQGPCPIFKEIGEKFGPIDLALLPIWRGGTLSFLARLGLKLTHHPLLSSMHASPADAVKIHQDVRSRHSIAMHFATFAGSDVEAYDPVVELVQHRDEAGIGNWNEEGGFGIINIGETAEIALS